MSSTYAIVQIKPLDNRSLSNPVDEEKDRQANLKYKHIKTHKNISMFTLTGITMQNATQIDPYCDSQCRIQNDVRPIC